MDTVSEAAMAAAMASLSVVAVVHCNTEPHAQAAIVRAAKSHCLPFVSAIVVQLVLRRLLSKNACDPNVVQI
jgi:IMP dehydrogenase/GMP reductase